MNITIDSDKLNALIKYQSFFIKEFELLCDAIAPQHCAPYGDKGPKLYPSEGENILEILCYGIGEAINMVSLIRTRELYALRLRDQWSQEQSPVLAEFGTAQTTDT